MCLPWFRRLRAWRSLWRAVRVATRARGFEEMCKSVHASRAGCFASSGASGDRSSAIGTDRRGSVAAASVHASRAGCFASSGVSGDRSSAIGTDRRGGVAAAVPCGGKVHALGHAGGS
eukprot:244489-Pleurochrysis_carterae.AAC.1